MIARLTFLASLLCAGLALADIPVPKTVDETLDILAQAAGTVPEATRVTIDRTDQSITVQIRDDADNTVVIHPDNLHIYLQSAANAAERQQIVDNLVASIQATLSETIDPASLRPVLRHRDMALYTQDASPLVSRPFVDETHIFYVVDTPSSASFITQEHLSQLGMTPDELDKIALSNLPHNGWQLESFGGSIDLLRFDGFYESSLILKPRVLRRLTRKHGRLAVATLTRDTVLIGPADDPATVSLMNQIAKDHEGQLAHGISSNILIFDGTSWSLN